MALDRQRKAGQPLYEQIRLQLQKSIEDSHLSPGQRLPTVTSLVKKWSVHPRTIKTALQMLEQDGLIRQEHGRGAFVTGSPGNPVETGMVFIRWSGDPFCVGLARGIQRFGREIHSDAVVLDAGQSHEYFLDVITHPPENTKGIILLPFDDERYEKAIRHVQQQGVKVVCVDRVLPNLHVSAVMADHFHAGYLGTRHLIETHGKAVHYIGTPASPSSQMERTRGWAAAMQEFSFHELKSHVWELPIAEIESATKPFDDIFRNPYLAAGKMFDSTSPEEHRCVFAGNDYIAKGVYMVAEERELRVGKDVFVVSFGDMPLCEYLTPKLSSVHQDYEEIGYEAAKLLQQELSGAVRKPIRRVLPVELRIRESSISLTGSTS